MTRGVLFVSPHREDASALSRMLASLSMPLDHAADLAHARAQIRNAAYQVILTEANLPDGTWLDVLDLAREFTPESEVIVTHRTADARFWAEALNMGAYDLIAQPFATAEVQRILSNACSRPEKGPGVARAAV
ncbi:MAG TPA: response regulator [Bryobacteraceae bacterium]|nr:response regulator [Bryobacteraceae bacterium]